MAASIPLNRICFFICLSFWFSLLNSPFLKKTGLPVKEADHLTRGKAELVLEVEAEACAHQLLPQIATLIGIDLGARVIQIFVFDECAHFGIEIVIRARDDLPREVCVTLPSASAQTAVRALKVGTRGFRKVDAHAGSGVRLEPSKGESQDEIPHKCAAIDPGSHAAASECVPKGIPQTEVSAPPEAIIKEVTFNGWTNYACAKDVTEFNAAEKPDVILRRDGERVSEER
jgi:hypothetical protein